MADAHASEACGSNTVEVQLLSPALIVFWRCRLEAYGRGLLNLPLLKRRDAGSNPATSAQKNILSTTQITGKKPLHYCIHLGLGLR